MATLLHQCSEVLHTIFQYVEPTDLAPLSRSCKAFHRFIESDQLLWKNQFLGRFDAPSSSSSLSSGKLEPGWDKRLMRLTTTEKVLESTNTAVKNEFLLQVLQDAIDMLTESTTNPDQNIRFLNHHFSNLSNVSAFLCRSSLFDRARYEADVAASSEDLRQLSAKLHVFSGLDVEPKSDDLDAFAAKVHPYARSRVYDLRRYTEGNLWGPFMDDGSQRPDWEKLQSIMIDLCYNVRMYTRRPRRIAPTASPTAAETIQIWNQPFYGISANSYESSPLEGNLAPQADEDLLSQDPYGVTGTWMRIVCFLDYNDLHAFNFENVPIPNDVERDPISTREAFRLIKLSLQITSIEPGSCDPCADPSVPIVHFAGTSKSTNMSLDPNANSRIRGSVRKTCGGAIRWTTFSIFQGDERWRSEGVQVGGIGSARGILGSWFDKDYDPHGPAGPTAFWKVSDDIVEEKQRGTTLGVGVEGLDGIGIAGVGAAEAWQQIIEIIFDQ